MLNEKELVDALLESSSLRKDLLIQVGGVLIDILNNIQLDDELCARVKDETYEFIKGYKAQTEPSDQIRSLLNLA